MTHGRKRWVLFEPGTPKRIASPACLEYFCSWNCSFVLGFIGFCLDWLIPFRCSQRHPAMPGQGQRYGAERCKVAQSEVFISSVAQKQLACQVKILKPLCTSTFCCHALKKHIQMWGSWLDRVGKQNSSNIP